MKRNFVTLGLLSLTLAACGGGENGLDGKDGKDGDSCTITNNEDGTATITCPDGSSFTIKNGEDGKKGDAGSDGEKGQNGQSCKLVENLDGSAAVVCPADGSSFIVRGNTDNYKNYCLPGFYGRNCENECSVCGEHSKCNDGITGDGSCICEKGWDGKNCDHCADGWDGLNCDECAGGYATPECVPATCKNGAPNLGLTGNGLCSSCFDKWTGPNCDVCPAGFYDGVTDCFDCRKGSAYFGSEKCKLSDTRAGETVTYNVVTIGNQTWMAENLKATKDINGNAVTCYANTDETNGGVSDFVEKYGCLYVWNELATLNEELKAENTNRICPTGWRLPTQDEFNQLLTATGASNNSTSIMASSWQNGSDSSGFSALPSGYRDNLGYFSDFGLFAHFWSATPYDDIFHACDLYVSQGLAFLDHNLANYAYSVRCLRD